MKGIILFDNLNDLAFIDADTELSMHIQRLAFKDGLLEDLSYQNKDGEVNKNVIMQLFSPLIASYKVMQIQFGNKYNYIETEDDMVLVFREILNYIAIMIHQKDESLIDIQKELSLFTLCVETFYGPSIHMIKENRHTGYEHISRPELLSFILKKWRILKMEHQMFLVEAVERLIINQEITAICINLLQEVLEKIRNSVKEATFCHAFLLVDTKLLALYSSRNSGQLHKETLLLLILFLQALKSSYNSVESSLEKYVDDEFFIPISTHVSKMKDEIKDKSESWKQNIDNKNKLKTGAQSLLIYLKSRSGDLVPHVVYAIDITNSISLVVLSELTQYATVSSLLSSLTKSLTALQNQQFLYNSVNSFETLEADLRSLIDSIWKMKAPIEKEKYIKKLVSKWEQLKQCDIDSLFRVSSERNLSPRLDSCMLSICEAFKCIFEEIVASPCFDYEEKSHDAEHQETFVFIQKMTSRRLVDVCDFLEVKALQNVTISSYVSEYPGLLHFIYIDRHCDYLISPSVVLRKGRLNSTNSLKQKIWNMVSVARTLIDGSKKFCCLWKDDDLYYLYTIWFENSNGKIIKPTTYPNLKNFPDKGIICGNFFKKLVKECFPDASHDHIFCYEIFCIHLESTPIETIIDHSRKLCSKLWDFTGAYRTSLDLL